MKLMVIVVCLLSERFLMHSVSYQRFAWFGDYCHRITQFIEKNNYFTNPWFLLASITVPIILVTALVYFLLKGVLFGFVGLILSILIFFYCLGPQNAFYPLSEEGSPSNTQVRNYLAQVNTQLFAVLFWYILAGPIAALTYRVISLSQGISSVSEQAKEVSDVLEWLPARLTVLLYLLVGNFQRGFSLFSQFIFSNPNLNNQMLGECGLQAVRSNETEEVSIPEAESLVEHAVIVLLVFIALFTLVAWM